MYHLAPALDKLLETAFSQNDLHSLTEAVSHVLKNPIAVYDTGYYILAYSATDSVQDPLWREGMKRGYCRYEYAAILSRLDHAAESTSQENRGTQIITNFGSARRRQERLMMSGHLVGYIAILENDTPFERIPEEYYHLAASLLAKEVSIAKSQNNTARSDSHSIVTDLLNDGFANKLLFRRRISGSTLDIDSSFRLLVIDTLQFRDTSSRTQIANSLSEFFPNAISSVFHRHHIVVLLDLKHQEFQNYTPRSSFLSFLEKKQLRCCVSDPFDDLYYLKKYYTLCSSVLELSGIYHDQRYLITYDSYKLQRSVSLIAPQELPYLCRSVIAEIYKNDQLENTENLQTLFCYLHTGKSLQKTAGLLFIHCNTVAYRIQRLCERYQLDFQNEFENFQLYYSCLILQALNPQQHLLPM